MESLKKRLDDLQKRVESLEATRQAEREFEAEKREMEAAEGIEDMFYGFGSSGGISPWLEDCF